MQSRNKRLAKNTLFLYIRMLLIMGVTLYTSRVVLRVLGFTDYGVYNVVGGVVAIFGFLNGAMSGASSRFLSFELGTNNQTRLNQIFNVLFVSHIGIAIIVLVLCETLGLWLLYDKLVIPKSQMTVVLWVYQMSVVSSILSIVIVPYSSVLISQEDMDIYAYVGLAEALLKLGTVLLLTIMPGNKLLVYAVFVLAVQFAVNIFYLIYCNRRYSCCALKYYRDYILYREVFGFVGSDLIGNISVLAQGQGLNILLNIFFGPVVNAARAITSQIQGAVQQFSGNFSTALRPQIIKLCAERNYRELFVLVDRSSYFSYYLMWILILPILLNSKFVLSLWLGRFPEYTIPFLNIVLWISMVQAIKTPRTMVFHGLGRIKLINMVVGGLLIMTFPIAYVALKLGTGPTSVFWISLIIIIISEFVSVAILKKFIKFSATKYLCNVHLRCFAVTVLSGIIPLMYSRSHPTDSFYGFVACTIISLLSILIVVYLIGMDKTTKMMVVGTVGSKLSKVKNLHIS